MEAGIVRLAEVTPQRWRNDGGWTSEVAAEQTLDGRPGWRISIARIDRSGSFSLFPEYSRTFLLISGRAILSIAGERHALRRGQSMQFGGDADVKATVGRAPAVALNIMSDPRRYSHTTSIVPEGGLLLPSEFEEQRYFIALAFGTLGTAELSPGDLMIDGGPRLVIQTRCTVACILFSDRSGRTLL